MTLSTNQQIIISDYDRSPSRTTAPKWWARPWTIPLMIAILGFLAEKLYSFWGVWDTSSAPVPPHPGFSAYFLLLGVHMMGAFIAMFMAVIQLWPRIRRQYPRLHRVSGRVYIVAALVSGACALSVLRFAGASGKVGIFLATVMWLTTTVLGFIYAWRGKYEMHRRFMLYSFATLMSIVWGVPIVRLGLLLPVTIDQTYVVYLVEASRWAGWLINILVVQWWLMRTAPRYAASPLTGRRSRKGTPALAVQESLV